MEQGILYTKDHRYVKIVEVLPINFLLRSARKQRNIIGNPSYRNDDNLIVDEAHDYGELFQRQNKILGNMLGCEIDFIVKGLDNSTRSVVASRKDAMYKKRQIFYLPDSNGNSRVCEDRVVQARVIAVAEKVIRVEIFGVECSILARDLSWD